VASESLMTVEQVADYLNVRFRRADVEAWVERRVEEGRAAGAR
jgi:hypothetical protein